MPSGGAGRGQGRPLTPATLEAVARRVLRLVGRLERLHEPPGPDLVLAAINLKLAAERLSAIAAQPGLETM